MNIELFYTFFIFSIFSLFQTTHCLNKLNICSNCKYFFVEKSKENDLHAKCLFFTKKIKETEESARKKQIVYLVTGQTVEKIVDKRDLFFCVTARSFESMCGLEGKKYERINL
jgi:hypothetical protein